MRGAWWAEADSEVSSSEAEDWSESEVDDVDEVGRAGDSEGASGSST